MGNKMKKIGTIAICGVSGDEVVVSAYNFNCPCLDCAACGDNTTCRWKYVLQTNPCTDDDMRASVCQNCIKITNNQQR